MTEDAANDHQVAGGYDGIYDVMLPSGEARSCDVTLPSGEAGCMT